MQTSLIHIIDELVFWVYKNLGGLSMKCIQSFGGVFVPGTTTPGVTLSQTLKNCEPRGVYIELTPEIAALLDESLGGQQLEGVADTRTVNRPADVHFLTRSDP